MSTWRRSVLVALVLGTVATSFAADDPVAKADEAKRLYQRRQYGDALAIWQSLITKHKTHRVVAGGDAYRYAALCLRQQGAHTDAAKLFEDYIKAHPKGSFLFLAHAGAFNAWIEAGDEAKAQKAGKRIFRRHPDAKGTYAILRTWLERGWRVPKLATSYKVLHYWTFNRVDASQSPDLRLAFLDLIAKWHGGTKLVKERGILYCQAWCHQTAGRSADAVSLGERYLRGHPDGDYADRTRIVVAKAYMESTPRDLKAAKKLLNVLARNDKSKQQETAKELLARLGSGPPSIQINDGFPTRDGLGKVVLLTNLAKTHPMRKALAPWIEARAAKVVRFQGRDVKGAAKKLKKEGAEFVAVAVEPGALDNDFQLMMLELARDLDEDPMPDFHYGYLVARDADDLAAFTRRIIEKDRTGGNVAREVPLPQATSPLGGIDFFIHYGHGTARGIVKGISAKGAAALSLPRLPVVFSGACFNGVCGRTYEGSIYQDYFLKPKEVARLDLISLAWIHAAATGLFAAIDGDRGEMAGAEWEYFKEHAPPLGEVIGYQYRLVFTSLRESFETFPRYTPGQRKNKSFYHVMLRGQTSRILISDPSYRPLKEPLTAPTLKTRAVRHGDGGLKVTVEVLRHANGPFVNTLPTRAGTPFRETRLYTRVALPEGFAGTLGFPQVDVGGIELTKVQAKHEVWGGRRYVNLQAESGDRKLGLRGTVATYVFRAVK